MGVRQQEMDASSALEFPLRAFEHSPVQFTFRCPGVQAYLLLANVGGKPIAFEQMTWDGGAWRLTLQLRPGTYRYRYYISDGHSTAYFSPSDAEPVGRVIRMEGMDGVFDVAPPFERLPRRDRLPRPSVKTVTAGAGLIELRAGAVAPAEVTR
jgi:hypothetical protein